MSDRIEQLEKKIADARLKISSNLAPGGDPSQRGASLQYYTRFEGWWIFYLMFLPV